VNSKHRKILQAVFGSPVPKEMPWADLEALLIAAGAAMTQGDGSRVKFDKDSVTVAFHRRTGRRRRGNFLKASESGHEERDDV
jgi:hypothetical protein